MCTHCDKCVNMYEYAFNGPDDPPHSSLFFIVVRSVVLHDELACLDVPQGDDDSHQRALTPHGHTPALAPPLSLNGLLARPLGPSKVHVSLLPLPHACWQRKAPYLYLFDPPKTFYSINLHQGRPRTCTVRCGGL